MKAIVKRCYEPVGRLKDIPNDLKALQKIVGGYIKTVTFNIFFFTESDDVGLQRVPEFVIICDEEGLIKRKPENCTVLNTSFVGTIIAVGVDGDEFTDCPISLDTWERLIS